METNRDHSVVFEIASKYCISDSSAGEGNDNPLQYSGLGDPMDRGA